MRKVKKPATREVYAPRLRILIDPVLKRLHAKLYSRIVVDPVTGCWNWLGAKTGGRYPAIARNDGSGRQIGRHLRKGMQALHTCDNDGCINPAHLYEGTQKQNMQDKHARGRHPRRYANRSLTDDQVRQIRDLCAAHSQYRVASMFRISRSVVQGIVERTKYKDVL
jgi:hypothetical protein